MKRVLASGVFDILHPGHEYYLEQSAALGDHLTVIVTSDAEAARAKRQPFNNAEMRRQCVADLPMVNEALIGFEPYDLIGMVRETRPDVIALGYDQGFEPTRLAHELAGHGIVVEVVRLEGHQQPHSTSQLLRDGQASS